MTRYDSICPHSNKFAAETGDLQDKIQKNYQKTVQKMQSKFDVKGREKYRGRPRLGGKFIELNRLERAFKQLEKSDWGSDW